MSEQFSSVAIIPARGGSKGVVRKNLQLIGGIPLIARAVISAKTSTYVGKVIVSTDDPDIATVATNAGADVIMRPREISTDTASSEDALYHAIKKIEEDNLYYDVVAFLQCTSPFVPPKDIDLVIESLRDTNINSAFAVKQWHGFLWNPDGTGVNHTPELPRQRRQDLPPCYLETGSVYAMKTSAFKACKSRFCHPWRPVLTEGLGLEVDTVDDLLFCQHYASFESGKRLAP